MCVGSRSALPMGIPPLWVWWVGSPPPCGNVQMVVCGLDVAFFIQICLFVLVFFYISFFFIFFIYYCYYYYFIFYFLYITT